MNFRRILCALALCLPLAASAQLAQIITIYPPSAKDITPHNTDLLTDFNGDPVNMYVYVTTGGDIVVQPTGNPDGETITFTLTDGQFVPVACRKVLSAGTTATGIIGIF